MCPRGVSVSLHCQNQELGKIHLCVANKLQKLKDRGILLTVQDIKIGGKHENKLELCPSRDWANPSVQSLGWLGKSSFMWCWCAPVQHFPPKLPFNQLHVHMPMEAQDCLDIWTKKFWTNIYSEQLILINILQDSLIVKYSSWNEAT